MSTQEEIAKVFSRIDADELVNLEKASFGIRVDLIADAVIAAGWRPPMRVITTVEELEALPVGAVIFNRNGESLQIQDNYGKEFYYAAADETPYGAHFLFEVGDGPFRVVWEPEQ